jgi:hypothetical protein
MRYLIILLFIFISFSFNGQVLVTLSLPDNCNVATDVEDLVETIQAKLHIYPNPNQGTFYMSAEFESAPEHAEICISDLRGKEVYRKTVSCESEFFVKQIDEEILTPGIYFVELKTKQAMLFAKMIITQ